MVKRVIVMLVLSLLLLGLTPQAVDSLAAAVRSVTGPVAVPGI